MWVVFYLSEIEIFMNDISRVCFKVFPIRFVWEGRRGDSALKRACSGPEFGSQHPGDKPGEPTNTRVLVSDLST